jgi:hypothetical protein
MAGADDKLHAERMNANPSRKNLIVFLLMREPFDNREAADLKI